MVRKSFKDPNDLREDTFAMRVNAEERQMLMALAAHLQRTQSDAVRLLVREAVRELGADSPSMPTRTPEAAPQEVKND